MFDNVIIYQMFFQNYFPAVMFRTSYILLYQEEQLNFVHLVSTADNELCIDDLRKNLEKVEAIRENGLNKLRKYTLFENQ